MRVTTDAPDMSGVSDGRILCNLQSARIYARRGDVETTEGHHAAALSLATENRDKQGDWRSAYDLAVVWETIGWWEQVGKRRAEA